MEVLLAKEADSTANLRMVNERNFLALPEAIFRNLRDEWLCIKDVVILDSAFCERRTRELFKALAYEDSKVYSLGVTRKLYIPFLHWVALRDARIDTLNITEDLLRDDDLRIKVLSANYQSLTALHYCNYEFFDRSCCVIFEEIVRLCPNVVHVHLDSKSEADQADQVDDCLEVLTRGLQQLTTLLVVAFRSTVCGISRAVAHCKQLQSLTYLGGGIKVNAGVAIPTLVDLNCSSVHVEADVLFALGQRCGELRSLYIKYDDTDHTDDHITDAAVRAVLLGCPKLRETDLAHSARISNELRLEIAARCNFTRLNLSKWELMDDGLAQDVLLLCPNLTELQCFYCEWLTDATLAVCAQHCPLLGTVSLWGCTNVTTNGVRVLLSKLGSQLRRIDLTRCPQLVDEAVLAVAEHCPQLTQLIRPHNVSDAAVVKLAQGCPGLTVLDVSDSSIGDAGLTALATHCPKLTSLVLHGCRKVTTQGVRALAENCRLLTHLGLPRQFTMEHLLVDQLFPKACDVKYR
jgi:hypothetical protein